MEEFVIFAGIILGISIFLINAIGATLMKNAAVMKGYGDDLHAWAICFWLGIFGYLYIIALPDRIGISMQNALSMDELPEL